MPDLRPSPFLARIDTVTLVRALSIILLVANHARILREGLHGGLNGLLLVSGISMATFAFTATTQDTLRAFTRFALRLAVPSIIVTAIYYIVRQNYSWTEILLISNWLTKDRIVLFPIWYVQAFVQMMAILIPLFWLFDLTPKLRQRPVFFTSLAFIFSLSVAMLSYTLWNTAHLQDKLPHLILWNLVFGWLCWALLVVGERSLKNRIILSAILLIGEYLIFTLSQASFGSSRFWWLSLFGLIVIWREHILLPRIIAHTLSLISQAAFFIFILHYFAFGFVVRISFYLNLWDAEKFHWLKFAAGLALPVLIWAIWTGMSRTYKRLQRSV